MRKDASRTDIIRSLSASRVSWSGTLTQWLECRPGVMTEVKVQRILRILETDGTLLSHRSVDGRVVREMIWLQRLFPSTVYMIISYLQPHVPHKYVDLLAFISVTFTVSFISPSWSRYNLTHQSSILILITRLCTRPKDEGLRERGE